jgi:hypothetical protein
VTEPDICGWLGRWQLELAPHASEPRNAEDSPSRTASEHRISDRPVPPTAGANALPSKLFHRDEAYVSLSNSISQRMKAVLVAEVVICFGPAAALLLLGALMVPLQLRAFVAEPVLSAGPVQVILLVIAGFIGLGALLFLLQKLFRDDTIERPIPVLAAVLLGTAALLPIVMGDSALMRMVALLPLVATAHILFLSRHLFWPLVKPSTTPWRSSGIWMVVPMLFVGLGLVIQPQDDLSRDELSEYRAAWLAAKPAAYSYQLLIDGRQAHDLLYPRRIHVRGNQVVSATFAFSRSPDDMYRYPSPAASAWTMDTVFDELIKAQAQGAKVRARFNSQWGYVERAEVEPQRPDSEWGVQAWDFEPSAKAPGRISPESP